MPVEQSKNERVELEMKILRYRKLADRNGSGYGARIQELIPDLEKELREIDE